LPDSRTMRVPLDDAGSPYAYVDMEIRIQTAAAGGVHGQETGHARSDIVVENGRWRVVVDLDPRLSREDAYVGLRHEANEVCGIVRRLYHSGLSAGTRIGPDGFSRLSQTAGSTYYQR
jgi:hypothetical protein